MTTYVILQRVGTPENWTLIGRADGASGRAAVAAFTNGGTEIEGEYIATPARSWKPVTVKVERTVKIA